MTICLPGLLSRIRGIGGQGPSREFDGAIILGVLARIWSIGTGPFSLLAIVTTLSPEVQGLYFAFFSIVSLVSVFELGLSQALIQFASHEWARLGSGANGRIEGAASSLSRLNGLLRFGMLWFLGVAVTMVLVLLPLGAVFFDRPETSHVDWRSPWFLLVLASALDVMTFPLLALVQGCGQTGSVFAIRLVRSIALTLCLWCTLLLGGGLWAAGLSTLLGTVVVAVAVVLRHGPMLRQVAAGRGDTFISWRREILPFQWRLSLTWGSGYLISYTFVPIAMHLEGPALAGRIGMTWMILQSVSATASIWMRARQATLGTLIALGNWTELDRSAWSGGCWMIGVTALGGLATAVLPLAIGLFDPALSQRLLPPYESLVFALGTTAWAVVLAQGYYLRAHKEEPYVLMMMASGAMVVSLSLLFGMEGGAIGIVLGYTVVVTGFSLPLSVLICARYRRKRRKHPP